MSIQRWALVRLLFLFLVCDSANAGRVFTNHPIQLHTFLQSAAQTAPRSANAVVTLYCQNLSSLTQTLKATFTPLNFLINITVGTPTGISSTGWTGSGGSYAANVAAPTTNSCYNTMSSSLLSNCQVVLQPKGTAGDKVILQHGEGCAMEPTGLKCPTASNVGGTWNFNTPAPDPANFGKGTCVGVTNCFNSLMIDYSFSLSISIAEDTGAVICGVSGYTAETNFISNGDDKFSSPLNGGRPF